MEHGPFSFATNYRILETVKRYHPEPIYIAATSSSDLWAFKADSLAEAAEKAKKHDALVLIYNHPERAFPDASEMTLQKNCGIGFGIVGGAVDELVFPFCWGDQLPIAPLIGRPFIHGIWDCYSLVRDVFRLGRDKLAEQEIVNWPFAPVDLPDVPRDDCWWDKGQDLYMDWLKPAGFMEIGADQVRPGDGFLLPIRSDRLNHAGVYIGDNQILHHIPSRLSRREVGGIWFRAVEKWVRYKG